MDKKSGNKKYKSRHEENISPYVETVVKINRVNKVVKGGRRLAFRAFVVVGDQKGQAGLGLGKAKEVPISIRKAMEKAKRSLIKFNTINDTVPHVVNGQFGASRVMIRPASAGTGVIAGGVVRIILEAIGVKNVVAKSLGSRSPINLALATINALQQCMTKAAVEKDRGIKLSVPVENK